MSRADKFRRGLSVALWAAALMGVAAAVSASEGVCRIGFCAPAAHLAALATGAPCVAEPEGYRLTGPGLDLLVAPVCAAVDFFGQSLSAGHALEFDEVKRAPAPPALWLLPVAFYLLYRRRLRTMPSA